MLLRSLLKGGDRRDTRHTQDLAAEALLDPSLIADLVAALLDPDELVRRRAAAALELVSCEKPDLLAPHAAAILGPAADLPQYDVRWRIAEIIPRLPLAGAQLRRAATVLRVTLRGEANAARVWALDGLVRLADRSPSLRAEAARAVARALVAGTPAEKARARNLRKRREWLGRR